jgi:hypothetical protein
MTTMHILAILLGCSWVLWIVTSIHTWYTHFVNRTARMHPLSPSFPGMPEVHVAAKMKAQLVSKATTVRRPSLMNAAYNAPIRLGSRSPPSPGEKRAAPQLNINHVHLSLSQYLWAAHFVAIPAAMLLVWGFIKLQLASLGMWLRLLQQPECATLHNMVVNLLLECPSLGPGFQFVKKVGEAEVATFVWLPFPFCHNCANGDVKPGPGNAILRVEVDVVKKVVVKATLDGEDVGINDLLVLLVHNIINVQHPKIHAYANWAVDPDCSLNNYLQKMSVVTTVYNHFGYNNTPAIMNCLFGPEVGSNQKVVFDAAMTSGVPAHPQIRQLLPHSRVVRFLVRLRVPFMQTFEEFRDMFPQTYSAEGYYLGTVVHSLDHFMFVRSLNPWQLHANKPSPKFAALHGMGDVARFMVSDDLPAILFARYFKHAPTKFHQKIYAIAKDIDALLADHIQTCIVK